MEIAAHILVGLTPPVKALLLDRREAVESLLKQIVSEHELEICKKDLNFLARMDPDKNSRKKKRAGGNYRTKAEQIAHTVSLCCSLRCFCLTTCLTPCLICFLLICKPVLRLCHRPADTATSPPGLCRGQRPRLHRVWRCAPRPHLCPPCRRPTRADRRMTSGCVLQWIALSPEGKAADLAAKLLAAEQLAEVARPAAGDEWSLKITVNKSLINRGQLTGLVPLRRWLTSLRPAHLPYLPDRVPIRTGSIWLWRGPASCSLGRSFVSKTGVEIGDQLRHCDLVSAPK